MFKELTVELNVTKYKYTQQKWTDQVEAVALLAFLKEQLKCLVELLHVNQRLQIVVKKIGHHRNLIFKRPFIEIKKFCLMK